MDKEREISRDQKAQELLRIISEKGKKVHEGKLKIFLGMVAGVGKTFSMLREAHTLSKKGVDVVIGLIETHGRKETEEVVQGLNILPRKEITYKEKIFEELDLELILQRKPQVVLVDELAHTNVPGVKHQKRYQDVLEILRAGIDVYTTLNVQHIESCAGIVRDMASITIKETLPDSIIDRANEIVLIDLAPEQILNRLQEGKIYPPEKIEASLANFFTENNLIALREIVLRLLADRVNSDLRDSNIMRGVPQLFKTSYRLLVPVTTTSDGENLIRATKRLSSGINATWLCGIVETGEKLTPEESENMKRNTNLAKQLGAEVVVIHDDDVVNGILRLARNYQITQIVLGKNYISSFKSLNKKDLFNRIINQSLEVDLFLVGDPFQKKKNVEKKKFPQIWDLNWQGWVPSLIIFSLVTILCFFYMDKSDYRSVGIIYLIYLNFNALFSGRLVIVLSTLLTTVSWNYLFIPPKFTFYIYAMEDWIIVMAFFVSSLITGLLTSKLHKKEVQLSANDERLSILYFLSKNISETMGVEKIVRLTLDKLDEIFKVPAGVMLFQREPEKTLDKL